MPLAPNLNVSNEQLSANAYVYAREHRDMLHRQVAFLDLQKDKHGEGTPNKKGGSRMIYQIDAQEHALAGTGVITGYETVNVTVQESLVPIDFSWGEMVFPIVISEREEFENSGEAQILDILKTRVENTFGKAKREFNENAVAGRSGDWIAKGKWKTLNGSDFTTDGWVEPRAVGAQTNTWGNNGSKATYAAAPGTQNGFQDVAGNYNSNGLTSMYSTQTRMRTLSKDPKACGLLASQSGYNNYKTVIGGSERYIDGKNLDAGNYAETYNGNKLYIESYMPNAGTNTGAAGDNEYSFYWLDPEDIFVCWDKETGYFHQTEFKDKDGQSLQRIAFVRVRGQLIARGFGGSAVIIGADTF